MAADALVIIDMQAGSFGPDSPARYDAEEASRIMGLKSDAIEAALGYTAGATLIHADDLALGR